MESQSPVSARCGGGGLREERGAWGRVEKGE